MNQTAHTELAALHVSLSDPLMDSMNFLNESQQRFPGAISFAAGAPNPSLLKPFQIEHFTQLYLEHVRRNGIGIATDRLLYEYGPSRGIINDLVSRAIAKDTAMEIAPRSVVITVGAQEALLLTLRVLFARSSDVLAVVSPFYVGIAGAASVLQIGLVAIHETANGPDIDELEEAIQLARSGGRRVRAVYVAPDYANPSGTVMGYEVRHRLVSLAEREDLFIIEDITYGFTAPSDTALPSLASIDSNHRVILIGTFAKICLPGVRVGFAVAARPIRYSDGAVHPMADAISSIKSMVTVNTSPICQAIVGGMLLESDCSLSSLAEDKALLYRRNLAHLLQALERELSPITRDMNGLAWNRPAGGFFVRVSLPLRVDTSLLEYSAKEFGVIWTPMKQFHLDDRGDYELRLSCSYLTEEQIDIGVSRFRAFIQSVGHMVATSSVERDDLRAGIS